MLFMYIITGMVLIGYILILMAAARRPTCSETCDELVCLPHLPQIVPNPAINHMHSSHVPYSSIHISSR